MKLFQQDKLLLFNSVRDDIEDKITEVMNNRTPSNVDIGSNSLIKIAVLTFMDDMLNIFTL